MRLQECLDNNRAYMIAEMSANHGHSIENAYKIVEAAAAAGADCVKVQTYTADTITIDSDAPAFQIHGGLWDGYKLYDLYKDAYTPWEWMEPIKKKCEECGVDFLSSPFDPTAVEYLENIGIEGYKIASFEMIDIPLVRLIASKGKPIIMSAGMASEEEISEALDACYSQGNKNVVVLKCCNVYPTVSSDLNLLTIPDMKNKFGIPIGLSDHSMGYAAAVGAAALGAQVIEKHFCLSRQLKTADSAFSMEPDEFKAMVEAVHQVQTALGTVHYGPTDNELSSGEYTDRRSLFVVEDIKKGEPFTAQNVRSIRPNTGLKPKHYDEILGKTANQDIKRGTPLAFDLINM